MEYLGLTMHAALALATVLIFIRSIYRVAELSAGFDGYLAENQPLFMVFEGVMIILATTLLTVFHPGLVFKGAWKEATWSWRKKSSAQEMPWTASSNGSSDDDLRGNGLMKQTQDRCEMTSS